MSFNTLSASTPTLLPGERFITHGNTADVELKIPATIDGPKRTEASKGRLWTTDQRVIFLRDTAAGPSGGPPNYENPTGLQSLEIPYAVLLHSTFNLPLFSANNISISFLPDPLASTTNLPSPGRGASLEVKLVIGEGAGHGVWKVIEGERMRVEEGRRRREEEDLRECFVPRPASLTW